MKRLIILFAVLAFAACRSPEENASTVVALQETAVTHWATQTAPTPFPLPLTATVKAYIDNAWATALAPTPTQVPPNPAQEAAAATTAAYRFAEQTAVIQARQLFADYAAGKIIIATVTPLPLPTVAPTPVELPQLIDLNTASAFQIAALPGNIRGDKLGLERALRILDYRERTGGIFTLDELDAVEGIGPAIIAAVRACECTTQE